MALRLKVANAEAVAAELKRFGPKAVKAMEGVVQRAVLRVSGRMVKMVQRGSRSGRTTTRPGGTTHTASAPGEPPKSDSGSLARNIKPSATKVDGVVVSGEVIVSVVYGGMLERGTSKMKPRPYAKPSFELERPAIQKDAKRAMKKAIG